MPERAAVFNIARVGVEVTPGTPVAATKRLLGTSLDPQPNTPLHIFRALGSLSPTTLIAEKEWTAGTIGGVLSYNDLVYEYCSLLTSVTPTTPPGATLTRRWTYLPNQFSPDTQQTFTVERGSSAGAERWAYCLIDSLTHRWTRTEAVQTGNFFGQALAEQFTLSGGVTDLAPLPIDPKSVSLYAGTSFSTNCVQTITIGGTPTGGTFTLTFDGQTTTPLAFNATGATVQTAFTALNTVNTNNATVTGAAGGPYTVTFLDRLAGLDVSTITGNTSLLTGGTPTFAVVRTTPGSLTKLLRTVSFEYVMPSRFTPEFTLNQGDPSFSYFVNKGIEPVHTLVVEHDSVSAGYMTSLRAKTQTYLCLLAWGPTIEAGFSNCLRMLFPFKFMTSVRGDTDDVYVSTYSLSNQYDSTLASYLSVSVDNNLATL